MLGSKRLIFIQVIWVSNLVLGKLTNLKREHFLKYFYCFFVIDFTLCTVKSSIFDESLKFDCEINKTWKEKFMCLRNLIDLNLLVKNYELFQAAFFHFRPVYNNWRCLDSNLGSLCRKRPICQLCNNHCPISEYFCCHSNKKSCNRYKS